MGSHSDVRRAAESTLGKLRKTWKHVDVRVPASATPGQSIQLPYMGKNLLFTVPPNVAPNGLVRVPIPPELMPTPQEHEEAEAEAAARAK